METRLVNLRLIEYKRVLNIVKEDNMVDVDEVEDVLVREITGLEERA